jgi:putative lipoprotein
MRDRDLLALLTVLALLAAVGGGCALDAEQAATHDRATPVPPVAPERPPLATTPKAFAYDCDELAFTVRIAEDTAQVFLPDRSFTLPRVPAASGAKYRDGATVFWSKGDEALLEVGDVTYRNCSSNPGRAVWENAKLRGVDFRALGNEPGWYAEIDDGERITIVTGYGQTRVRTPAPAPEIDPQAARTTYRVRTEAHDLTITIEGKACRDTMSGEAFSSTVAVVLDGRQYRGCGRALR